MTQGMVEFIVREIRTRCLHSSWDDLMGFWKSVMDNLEGAYRAAVQNAPSFHCMSAEDYDDMQRIVRDKLAVALSHLAGEEQVTRWDAEATEGIKSPSVSKSEIPEPDGS